ASPLIAVGGAFLAIFARQQDFANLFPNLPQRAFLAIFIIGLVLVVLGLTGMLFLVISFGFAVLLVPIQNLWTWIKDRFEASGLECRIAKRRDIEWMHQFGQQELGVVADINKLLEWQSINREIFWIIINNDIEGDRLKKLMGYFAVIPLNDTATTLVEAEKIDGTSFSKEHIIARKKGRISKTPAAIYIGGVAAKKGLRLRYFTLDSLKAHITSENSKHGVQRFYTRAVTDDGLRLIKRYEFSPVSKYVNGYVKNHIYKKEFDGDDDD
ncbi:MAG TPA: hypothetical protein VHH35_19145, partial [Pyrinomonadaceae bacterium]|nr:hypothetical protein [Pyrinomonadaceae bacterium]